MNHSRKETNFEKYFTVDVKKIDYLIAVQTIN